MAQEKKLHLPEQGLPLETITQELKQQFPQYTFYRKSEGLAVDKSPLVGVQITPGEDNILVIRLKDPGPKGQYWFLPGSKLVDEVTGHLMATFHLQDDDLINVSAWRRWQKSRSVLKIFALIIVPLVFAADFFYQVWGGGIDPGSRQGNLLVGMGSIFFSIPCFSLTYLFGEILEPLFAGDWPAPMLYNILKVAFVFSGAVGVLSIQSGLGK